MRQWRLLHALVFCTLALPYNAFTQQESGWQLEALSPEGGFVYDRRSDTATATNGARVVYGDAVLTADKVVVNIGGGEAIADGHVRIQHADQIWAGEHIRYNFLSHQIEARQFKSGKPPMFAAGEGLHAEVTNQFYDATNALITSDDVAEPGLKIRARRLKIIPGKEFTAYHAVVYLGDVPIFYVPYYYRELGPRQNNFNFIPGYRSEFGPFLLSHYTWYLNQQLDGMLRLDYRQRRGVGGGPDINYHLGPWGEGTFKYYYMYDQDPDAGDGTGIPDNRQRVYFSYHSLPLTNLDLRAMVRYQSDNRLVRDFFESEYRQNPQPSTFFEANHFGENFSLDTYVQPRVNDFLETVERLPDVRLTGYRQQVGDSPLFYESESSAGYYRRLFADTNGPPTGLEYSAGRADTYHQLVLPETLFGWLNVTPRVGGRFTYYGSASGPGATTEEVYRGVFNTGAEVSFKASRVWPAVRNNWLELDGLRHIVEPSVNYVYVPTPAHVGTNEIPQFDSELPSLRLLPIEYPDYNAIDSIDSQNVLRFGLHNKLQTKRQGQVVTVANWDLYTDWRLRPREDQTTFADVYSDLVLKPRSWLTLESLTRFDVANRDWRMSLTTLTLQPANAWSWTLGQFYLRDDFSASPTALGQGNNLFLSTIFFRLNENWGLRAYHRFEAKDGRLEEQAYSLYRDLRSWTAALTFRLRDNSDSSDDFTVAFTFSLKVNPRYPVGIDTTRPYYLLGE